jgi:ferredoxin
MTGGETLLTGVHRSDWRASERLASKQSKSKAKQSKQSQLATMGDEPNLCAVCVDEDVTIELPCRHAVLCSGCVVKVQASNSACPVCRAAFVQFTTHKAGAHAVAKQFKQQRLAGPLRLSASFNKLEELLNQQQRGIVDALEVLSTTNHVVGLEDHVLVMQVMATHQDSAVVQGWACKTLWSMAQNGPNGEPTLVLVAAGAHESILRAMDAHQDDVGLQDIACYALACFVQCEDTVGGALFAAGAHKSVIRAMNAHQDSVDDRAGMQESACAFLAGIAVLTECDSGVRETLFAAGAHKSVIRAMDAHQDREELQDNGCRVLRSLVINGDYVIELVAAGAHKSVIRAMDTHQDNEYVQDHGCCALTCFAVDDENVIELVAAGAHNSILRAMDTHQDNEELQQDGCSALNNLACDDDNDNALVLVAAGAQTRIVSAMAAHPNSENIQSDGAEVMHRLNKFCFIP